METEHITVEHLIAYAAQALTQTETSVIRDHVVVCPECNTVVLLFKNIRRLVLSNVAEFLLALYDCLKDQSPRS